MLSCVHGGWIGRTLDCGSGKFDLSKVGVRVRHLVTSGGPFSYCHRGISQLLAILGRVVEARPSSQILHEEVCVFELRKGMPVGSKEVGGLRLWLSTHF